MDEYDKAENRAGPGNRLGGIGNPFRTRAIGKPGLIGQKGLVMDTLSNANFGGTSYTTTDTTQWLFAAAIFVNSYYPQWSQFCFGSVHVKHSAANATFGMALYLYSDPNGSATGTYYNPSVIDNVAIPVQNGWFPVAIIGNSNSGGSLAFLPIGSHYLALGVRNYTTGTLTVIQPNDDFLISWGGPWS